MSNNHVKQHVLIVGGGFAGIKVALELAEDEHYKITLISDHSNFRYYPALYRTATGGAAAHSNIPLATLFEDKPVKLVYGSAQTIDRKAHTITLADKRVMNYDIVIFGLGVVTNYFGIPGMEQFSYSIKSMEQINRFKDHIHNQLTDDRRPDLNYVIVGGGPTGIELAGALPEYLRKIMAWHGIKRKAIHIDLIEAAPRLLPRMPKSTSIGVTKRLRSLGVRLYMGKVVQGMSGDELTVSGKPIRSHTVVWTAGVTIHPFFKENNFLITPRGKVATDMYLQADENIFVVGDNANTPYSGMAQTALVDAVYVAESLKRRARGEDPESYKLKKPITVIPVGDHWATVLWGRFRLYGVIGWGLREMADLIAFTDYQPWWKAGKQWLRGFEENETCAVCRIAMAQEMVDK